MLLKPITKVEPVALHRWLEDVESTIKYDLPSRICDNVSGMGRAAVVECPSELGPTAISGYLADDTKPRDWACHGRVRQEHPIAPPRLDASDCLPRLTRVDPSFEARPLGHKFIEGEVAERLYTGI